MKRYERELYNSLNGRDDNTDEPLKNVKNAMGSLRHLPGNPMFKAEITLQITTVITNDVLGIIAPALLPAALQNSVPVFLFGLTDFYSGYEASRRISPVSPPWAAAAGIAGEPDFGIWQVNRVASIMGGGVNYDPGDMILSYAAGVPPFGLGDNYNIEIRIHCNNIGYGTFLNSFVSDLITVNMMRLNVPAANINQYQNPLIFGYQTLFGKLSTDSVDPRMYITPGDFQQQIVDIPITYPVDKNLLLGFQLDVFCQLMTIQLMVQKVEPLTLRKR